jgi:ankyrin repeat protein
MRKLVILGLGAMLALNVYASDTPVDIFQAIGNGDIAYVKAHATPENLQLRDRRGATPLMFAAAFGNLETVAFLLDRGAAVNAANDFGATALLWSARDPEKARLLVEHGADVNARSKQGRTPLMLAASRPGGSATVSLLLSKGADPKVKDGKGYTALHLAATIGDAAIMRLLLARGADPNALNDKGESPLIAATRSHNAEAVRLLLQKDAKVNVANTSFNTVRNGEIALIGIAPLHRAAAFGPIEMVRDLLKAGAKTDVRDSRGLTPLMFAVAADTANPEIVRALLQAGADVALKDENGETVLDWADKFQHPEILAALRKAGATRAREYRPPQRPDGRRPDSATAVTRALALLEKSSGEFFRQSGCVACHHQPAIARTQAHARAAGLAIDEAAAHEQSAQLKAQWLSSQEEFLQAIHPGGGPNRLADSLLGFEAAGHAPDSITAAAAIDIAEGQEADGHWQPGDEHPRPPITESVIAATARIVRVIQVYAPPARRAEFAARVDRARVWLQHATPVTTDDHVGRLLGLIWSKAPSSDVRAAAQALAALQREDGAWAPTRYAKTDAYATGETLSALAEAGMSPADPVYQRGADYLLATQFPDGAWHVRSRALKFQPYFESGFPFAHDQWISAAATAWATQALTHALAKHVAADQRR